MRVTVGIPVYDNKLQMDIVGALLTEQSIASKLGVEFNVRYLPSCTNLAMGRNQIVKEFLESGDDKLIFLDADVSFEPGAMMKIALTPFEIVGGCYRLKQEEEKYPIAFLDEDELWSNEHGLIEVAMLPTGFLCISKEAFEKFRAAYPDRMYESRGQESFCYFQIPYRDGCLYTEDSYFCREWREIGGKMYLHPDLTLTHWQFNTPYVGNIGKWLKSQSGVE